MLAMDLIVLVSTDSLTFYARRLKKWNISGVCWTLLLVVLAVCSTPSLEANGKWTPHKPRYQIGETVWLQCLRKRYKLADQTISSVTCGKDTQWSIPRPICQGNVTYSVFSIDPIFLNAVMNTSRKASGKRNTQNSLNCPYRFTHSFVPAW